MYETNIRKEFRQLVIMGCHPECKIYNQALKAELVIGCKIRIREDTGVILCKTREEDNTGQGGLYKVFYPDVKYSPIRTEYNHHIDEIIGLPITIGRVIQALPKDDIELENLINILHIHVSGSHSIDWKLIKDGKECVSQDQDIETISKLLKLLK